MPTEDEIVDRFTYHPPKEEQIPKYVEIRDTARQFALVIHDLCPDSPELDEALTYIDIAVMRANASIARHS
jgi:hypothetical protein